MIRRDYWQQDGDSMEVKETIYLTRSWNVRAINPPFERWSPDGVKWFEGPPPESALPKRSH